MNKVQIPVIYVCCVLRVARASSRQSIVKFCFICPYKGKAIPLQAGKALRVLGVEAPSFQDIQLMKVVRLSVLRTGCLYT